MKKAIAMRCSQKTFESIKNELIKSGLKIEQIRDFKTSNFLVNNFAGVENVITNVLYSDAKNHEREIHETFNAKIFLESCGIETDVYEITKEQVRMIEPYYSAVKFWFPEAFKNELEVGKWYKSLEYPKQLINVVDFKDNQHIKAYGFSTDGIWEDDDDAFSWGLPSDGFYKEATHQEVEAALIKEAKKVYKLGDYVFDEWSNCTCKINQLTRFDFCYDGLFVLNENNSKTRLLHNGIWAAIINTITIQEAELFLKAHGMNKKIV